MKHVFSEKSQNIDRFSLNGVVSFPKEYYADNLFNVDNYILERYKEGNIEVQNLMKNKLKENGYIQRPHLNKINKLEQEAIMYAQPYPLNKESAEKLFGNAFWVDDADIDQKDIKQVIDSSKIIHIHPSTGKEDQYSYDISVNSIFNPETVKTSKVNKVLQASCTIRNLEELLVLIQDYIGILYITGCHRSKKLLDELKSRGKDNKIYINSVASLTSSIEFINEHFNGNEAEIVQTKYCDILLMKNSKYVFFQYLLPGSQEILQKAISEQRICLKRLIFSQKCTLLKQIEWDRIENFTEEYFKECCTYMAKKSW